MGRQTFFWSRIKIKIAAVTLGPIDLKFSVVHSTYYIACQLRRGLRLRGGAGSVGLERAAGLLEEEENQDGCSDLRAH